MPLFLRAASPAQVHALSPTNPQVLRLQSEDPDLQTLYAFRTTRAWPNNLQPDHRLCLETLNKNLMIDQDNVVWVQCKPESPEAKTALYLPIKFRAPIICQFRQINPDLSVSQQVAKLQENYCWIGMDAATAGIFCQLHPTESAQTNKISAQCSGLSGRPRPLSFLWGPEVCRCPH